MRRRPNQKGGSVTPESTTARGATKSHSETASELKLLRALIDRCAGSSPPSQLDVERRVDSGLARLMLLEGRLRGQPSRAGGTRPGEGMCEDHDLVEEIRALREAVTELRARTNAGESALAYGFVIPRRPGLGGGAYLPMDGSSPAARSNGAAIGASQPAYAALAVERHDG
jgi:hypothetical protein